MKPLTEFLDLLLTEGKAIVQAEALLQPAGSADLDTAKRRLKIYMDDYALTLPGLSPRLCLDSACWAAQVFAWAVSLSVDRSQSDLQMPAEFNGAKPPPQLVRSHLSVDVVFQFAIDLILRTTRLDQGSELENQLTAIFQPWPLACVGTTIDNPVSSIETLLADPCANLFMADRIVNRKDQRRSAMPEFRNLVLQRSINT